MCKDRESVIKHFKESLTQEAQDIWIEHIIQASNGLSCFRGWWFSIGDELSELRYNGIITGEDEEEISKALLELMESTWWARLGDQDVLDFRAQKEESRKALQRTLERSLGIR